MIDPARKPTMTDVAREAGVSQKTVSRVLNGEPNVRPHIHERVLHTAEELGYRRNSLAASLTSPTRGRTIGVLIEDLADPFWAAMISGVEEQTQARNYSLLIASSAEDPDREQQNLDMFLSRQVDGVIVVPSSSDHAYLRADIARGTAVIFVDRPATNIDVDTISIDHFAGARAAAQHLLAHGHTKIGYVGHTDQVFTGTQRRRGFESALEDAGVRLPEKYLVTNVTDSLSAELATIDLLQTPDPPTAIFADNNRAAAGVLRALNKRDASHLAVIGFDDFEFAEMLGITVISHDGRSLGRSAAARLLDRLDGKTDGIAHLTLATTLIARGSGERPPERAT